MRNLARSLIVVSCLVLAATIAGTARQNESQSGDWWELWNEDETRLEYWSCTQGGLTASWQCNDWQYVCEGCHTSKLDRKRMTTRHRTVYYPRAEFRLPAGERLAMKRDLFLINRSGTFYVSNRDGRLLARLPTGARVLKNRAGRPFAIQSPSKPVLIAR